MSHKIKFNIHKSDIIFKKYEIYIQPLRFSKMTYRNALMHSGGLIGYMTLTLNIFMTITLYMACNSLIFTILFGLSESFKITLFIDFILNIIEI